MTGKDKDQIGEDGAVQLDEDALGEAQGGLKWDVVTSARNITLDNGLKSKLDGIQTVWKGEE